MLWGACPELGGQPYGGGPNIEYSEFQWATHNAERNRPRLQVEAEGQLWGGANLLFQEAAPPTCPRHCRRRWGRRCGGRTCRSGSGGWRRCAARPRTAAGHSPPSPPAGPSGPLPRLWASLRHWVPPTTPPPDNMSDLFSSMSGLPRVRVPHGRLGGSPALANLSGDNFWGGETKTRRVACMPAPHFLKSRTFNPRGGVPPVLLLPSCRLQCNNVHLRTHMHFAAPSASRHKRGVLVRRAVIPWFL